MDPRPSSNAEAAEQTIAALETTVIDAAVVTAVRKLAAAIDTDPGNASLWREYRSALEVLYERCGDDDLFNALINDLYSSVRDSEDRSTDTR